MSAEVTLILGNAESRARARAWISRAPEGTALAFRKPKRSREQNDMLHGLLTDIARQVEWCGRKLTVDAWKDIMTAAWRASRHELDVVPGINGGFVMLGMHTSRMTKDEVSDLIEMTLAFGAEHEVAFTTPGRDAFAAERAA